MILGYVIELTSRGGAVAWMQHGDRGWKETLLGPEDAFVFSTRSAAREELYAIQHSMLTTHKHEFFGLARRLLEARIVPVLLESRD